MKAFFLILAIFVPAWSALGREPVSVVEALPRALPEPYQVNRLPVSRQERISRLLDPRLANSGGKRSANPRINKLNFELLSAEAEGRRSNYLIEKALRTHGISETPQGRILRHRLSDNLRILKKAGSTTPEDLAALRLGRSPVIRNGPFLGQPFHVDHILPLKHTPHLGNEYGNLRYLPASQNLLKGASLADSFSLETAQDFRSAGKLTRADFARVYVLNAYHRHPQFSPYRNRTSFAMSRMPGMTVVSPRLTTISRSVTGDYSKTAGFTRKAIGGGGVVLGVAFVGYEAYSCFQACEGIGDMRRRGLISWQTEQRLKNIEIGKSVGYTGGGIIGGIAGGMAAGAAYGAIGGSPTGPGAVLTTVVGSVVGGVAGGISGAFAGDRIDSKISPEEVKLVEIKQVKLEEWFLKGAMFPVP